MLLPAAFVWGYQTHQERIFPYSALRQLVASKQPRVRRGVQSFATQALPVGAIDQEAGEAAALAEIGYVDGTFDASADDVRGVYRHDPKAAFQGLNLYYSRFSVGAALLDMNGRPLHEWHGDVEGGPWQNVRLLEDGSVLVIIKEKELQKRDRDSALLWRISGDFHHDLDVRADGSIVVLGKHHRLIPAIHPTVPAIDPAVVEISEAGTILSETSLTDALLASPFRGLLPAARTAPRDKLEALDILHANHIEVLEGPDPLFGSGNFLVSMRTNSLVAIFDPAVKNVLWAWGPSNILHQHHPNLLENGNILVFDNGARRSRIVELDPRSFQIVWQYGPNEEFFSKLQGSCQRLPNGNTLITESESGYVFEVTEHGEIVWGFANPAVREGKVREAIWRMARIARSEAPWLSDVAESTDS
jgi:hypothetical protein